MEEINKVYDIYIQGAIVPFRDASTKNMILNCKKLFVPQLGNAMRYEFYRSLCETGEMEDIIQNNQIIDIDFCSCLHLTTPYDDEISFKFHERTFKYFDYKKIDNWLANDYIPNENTKNHIIAATFITRYLRFGGRKALYSLLDKEDYDVRFKYDNELFYFEIITEIITYYWRDAKRELPRLLLFFKQIANKIRRKEPYFNIDSEYKEKIKDVPKKNPYEDIIFI